MSACMRVAVVGATGAVGTVDAAACCASARFPAREIVPFASERSAGRELDGRARSSSRSPTRRSRASTSRSSRRAATTSREWAPRFVEAGAVVVDNSSRLAVRPRRAARRLRGQPGRARRATTGMIANPNCSTMQLMVALKPIHDAAGHRAPDRLDLPVGVRHRRRRRSRSSRTRPHAVAARRWSRRRPRSTRTTIAFNVLGGAGNFADGDDHTDEERKMMFETRKILGDESIAYRRHLRARAGRLLALGVGERADPRAARGRGGARAAGARCRA